MGHRVHPSRETKLTRARAVYINRDLDIISRNELRATPQASRKNGLSYYRLNVGREHTISRTLRYDFVKR